jgi:thymidylate kinase
MKPQQITSMETRSIDALQTGCSSEPGSRANFVRSIFEALEATDFEWCVLHSFEELPETVSTDIDIALHPDDMERAGAVFGSLHDEHYRIVQCFEYAPGAKYFVFASLRECEADVVAIDIISKHYRGGLLLADGRELLDGRRRYRGMWVASAAVEFAYLLGKETLKGFIGASQEQRLTELILDLGPTHSGEIARDLFGSQADSVLRACKVSGLREHLPKLKRRLRGRMLRRHPLGTFQCRMAEMSRFVQRFLRPTGLFVAVLGPDGVGKSTLISALSDHAVGFRRHRLFHWRPMLLWKPRSRLDASQPHSVPPRTAMSSAIRLLLQFLDYWLGYSFLVRPLLMRSTLVVFDRYFDDVRADPLRYRYGGPEWLPRLLRPFTPRPDIVFVLDAPAKMVYERKQELTIDRIRAQRLVYHKLACEPEFQVVNSERGSADVLKQVLLAILNHLERRMKGRYAS